MGIHLHQNFNHKVCNSLMGQFGTIFVYVRFHIKTWNLCVRFAIHKTFPFGLSLSVWAFVRCVTHNPSIWDCLCVYGFDTKTWNMFLKYS